MVIPVFRGNKGEDLEVFLREYKKTCIGTKHKTIIEWFNLFPEFSEGTTSHWFERQIEILNRSWNDITKTLVKNIF